MVHGWPGKLLPLKTNYLSFFYFLYHLVNSFLAMFHKLLTFESFNKRLSFILGSFVEFLKITPMLTKPDDSRDYVFEVIAPSIPGKLWSF